MEDLSKMTVVVILYLYLTSKNEWSEYFQVLNLLYLSNASKI